MSNTIDGWQYRFEGVVMIPIDSLDLLLRAPL